MPQSAALYPGTFDPITLGHLDIITRASKQFSTVIVAIASSDKKSPCFDLATRLQLTEAVLKPLPNVKVLSFDGLLVTLARKLNVRTILRGLRTVSDFEYEFQLAGINRKLSADIETFFMLSAEQYAFISSSMAKEVARLGGNVDAFVPPLISDALKKAFKP